MQLAGKAALVTGGAVRVGKAITLMLAEQGADVAIVYHTSEREAAETTQAAQELGVRALAIRCDVANVEDVNAMARAVAGTMGGVDVIVHSASLFAATPISRRTGEPTALDPAAVEEWRRVTRTLVDGPWFVTTALLPIMRARGGGVIINILDLAAWKPWRGFAAHTAGKAALLGLTRQMALELAPTIRVNGVAPGPVLPPPGYPAARVEAAARRTLLGRWGTPHDVAHAVRYLIEADYVTGEVIFVDGGERLARPGE